MKKATTVISAMFLLLAVSACSIVSANTDVPVNGSTIHDQSSEGVFSYSAFAPDPVDLCCDNPLGNVEISSVSLQLAGVGEYEITGADADTIKSIVQNDERIWQDRSGWETFEDATYINTTSFPLKLMVTLASGERLALYSYESSGAISNALRIDNEQSETQQYELTPEEFADFNAVHDRAYESFVAELDDTITPFVDLTEDDLVQVERIHHYLDKDQSVQLLTNWEIKKIVATLNELELEPASAIFNPETMMGGGYAYFILTFENGEEYAIGSHTGYSLYNEEKTEFLESIPVVYFDGVLYQCNKEFANDIYWDFEETAENYQQRYLEGRTVSDHPFEELKSEEIQLVTMGLPDSPYAWTSGIVSQSMFEDIAEVMRTFEITDDKKLAYGAASTDGNGYQNGMTLYLSNGQQITVGIDGDYLRVMFADYEQDADVIAAFKKVMEDACQSHYELIESTGNWVQAAAEGETEAKQRDDTDGLWHSFIEYATFMLPDVLVEHDDGYYPQGYTLEDAPLSVTFGKQNLWSGTDNSASLLSELNREMTETGGRGYFQSTFALEQNNGDVLIHWGNGSDDTELYYSFSSGNFVCPEILITGSDDYEITPEAVFALVLSSVDSYIQYTD